jgi:sugar phosphate permease
MRTSLQRLTQLALLVSAAGSLFPLIYLRQNFELTLLDTLGITLAELSECYAILGVTFTLSYLPSGLLADRVQARGLIAFSLALTAILGSLLLTEPSTTTLRLLFLGWGISSGLTFWSALIKAVSLLAEPHEQGRYFGILDGGRGLVEAVLATLAVLLFARLLNASFEESEAMKWVIGFYLVNIVIHIPLTLLFVDAKSEQHAAATTPRAMLTDIVSVLSNGRVWFCALSILVCYQVFWTTYSFSAYLQEAFSASALAAASLTVMKLWTRPLGATAAGFFGDHFGRYRTLAVFLISASLAVAFLALLPQGSSQWLVLIAIFTIGLTTYGLRGLYWSTLDDCGISNSGKGLAIGIISMIAYTPDIYLPLLNSALLDAYPGRTGYAIYFLGIAALGLVSGGVLIAKSVPSRVAEAESTAAH